MGPQLSDDNDSDLLQKLSEYLPVSTTRVETALSRFPIHNLTKSEKIAIRINRKNQAGETDISWSVSPSRDHGEPRQLAYKLDTLVINRRIDEANRPVPRLLRLGTLRDICRQLGVQMNGPQAHAIKQALYQNAFAGITAKVSYKSADGRTRRFEKGFTRYSVYFAGEELPNEVGTADAVYIFMNEDYWQLLNNAIFRPLDYEYQKALSAGAQRFYELVSFAMYAALSKRRDEAKLVYSDYCLRAPQTRYYTRAKVQKQMYKLHRPHVKEGYLKDVRYRQTTDQDGQADWEIFYTPGPRARAQYTFFTNRQKSEVFEVSQVEGSLMPAEAPATDSGFLEKLLSRGISSAGAKKILGEAKSDDELSDLLEWGDYLVGTAKGKIRNPAGFYIYLFQDRVLPPANFETSRLRKLREAAQQKADEERVWKVRLQLAYEDYQEETVDRHIAEHLTGDAYTKAFEMKRKEIRRAFKNLPESTVEDITRQAIRRDLKAGAVVFMSPEEFARSRRHPDQMTLLPV